MYNCKEYRIALEDIIGAYFEHGDGPGLRSLMQEAKKTMIENIACHRHEGWEGPAEACPICRADYLFRNATKTNEQQASRIRGLKDALEEAEAALIITVAYRSPMQPNVNNACQRALDIVRSASGNA